MSNLSNLISDAKSRNIPFSKGTFEKSIDTLIEKNYFDDDRYANVDDLFDADILKKLNITPDEKEQLVNLQKLSPFIDDKDTSKEFLPIALYNIRSKTIDYSTLSSVDGGDIDSSVEYFADTSKETNEFVKQNIEFAAQLYYVMVMGDELEVFNAADALISKHLRSKKYSIDIRAKKTLDSIRMYAFGERFENLKTGESYERSQEAERMMFYKQVFDMGHGTNLTDIEVNSDFGPLWDTLMVEVTSLIEKVEDSSNYDNISRNNIYQSIEDLQYNLSNNCTGLVKISSNVMNLELRFIMKRLFDDKDIKEQVGKRDRSPFGVLKQILIDLNSERGMKMQNIIALNNKAILGHKIIMDISRFSQAYMETGDNFGSFITNVQAYFLAQKIIEKQNAGMSVQGESDFPTSPFAGRPQIPVNDEWDY